MLITDRKGNSVSAGDYVLVGLQSNGLGDTGRMWAGEVLGKTGHGIQIDGFSRQIKVSHKITKVDKNWALQFQEYLK